MKKTIQKNEFIKTRTEINAIGKNIYQLLKILRSGQLGAIIEKNNERI